MGMIDVVGDVVGWMRCGVVCVRVACGCVWWGCVDVVDVVGMVWWVRCARCEWCGVVSGVDGYGRCVVWCDACVVSMYVV